MKSVRRVYLDNAATTPIDPQVLAIMLPYLKDNYGNPSSLHIEGRIAKKAVEESRAKIANIIGGKLDEVIFTSGGTEADNLAILGIAHANKARGKHIITSCIEHKAVLDACQKLEKEGFEVTYLKVNKEGIISLDELKKSLRVDTILISIMYANNEIGAIQPIKKIASEIQNFHKNNNHLPKMANGNNIFFHTDACQAAEYLSLDIKELGVDAMTVSSSKIYGPKGSGCLYLSRNVVIEPIIYGGGQEGGIRSGTENVAGIMGLAKALLISEKRKIKENLRLTNLRDYFLANILKKIEGVTVNGGLKNRLPNNINISISGVEGESLVLMLDNYGVYCSTGSACSSADLKPSYVLTSIGTPVDLAHCSVRFTLGRYTKKIDLDYTVSRLAECVKIIRKMSTIK